MPPSPCRKPRTELVLNSIVAGLFHEQRVPAGAIIDAGAHDGSWSCLYAVLSRGERAVYAIEPLAGNVKKIEEMRLRHSSTRSIQPMVGALGNATAWLDAGVENRIGQIQSLNHRRAVSSAAAAKAPFRMHRLDDLVFGDGRSTVISGGLGFAHFDCEGSEADVLRGGWRSIARWQPLLTVELHVHANQTYTQELIGLIEILGYDAFMVEEPCGVRQDCRNLLCLPRARRDTLLDSPTLDLAVSGGVLLAVGPHTILRYAYPCCRAGGTCCPRTGGSRRQGAGEQYHSCCSHWRIDEWRRGVNLTHKGTPREMVRAEKWTTQNWWHGARGFAASNAMSKWQP
jgi:FkbM family methyltransferase